ncbi:hypothetical protein B7494_g3674 [Chlorociboria aeruginascens]|nr:hypothetical protein B7494_g3674 [Chlorociboria aeruginascens]
MRQIERETARSKQNLPKEKSQASTPAKKNVPKEKALAPAKAAKPKVVKKTASESLDLPSSSSSGPTRTKQTARPCKETLEKWAARKAAGLYVPDPVWPPKQQEPPPPEPSSSASPRKKQTAIRSKTTPGPIYVPKREPEVDIKPSGFDATGFFKISCPEIDEQWGDSSLTLEIHIRTSNGRTQMFGLFDFNVIQGIMRFEKPVPVPKSKSEPDSKKRKWETDEEDDDGYIDMEDYPDFETEPSHYSNSVFNLGAKDKPTARRPTWQYRWRGRETGEGEIQLYSDKQIQSITFSKKGDQLSGTLKNDLLDCKFTGTKIRSTSPTAVNPDSEWDIYSESAYNYASRSRWAGSW